jgi:hypothetical protein
MHMNANDNPLFNAETVNHALPSDPREIAAAISAASICYDHHPYFHMRYGRRGSLFARSDGGYLVTLVDQPQSKVDEQVLWLAALLSGKGMPRWLMETHLDLLYEALSLAVPEKETDYRKLRHSADLLREARRAWIPQERFDELTEYFYRVTRIRWSERAGGLMGAAVCDECSGLDMAVPSLLAWMGDANRFSPQWCAAVSETISRARRMVTA